MMRYDSRHLPTAGRSEIGNTDSNRVLMPSQAAWSIPAKGEGGGNRGGARSTRAVKDNLATPC